MRARPRRIKLSTPDAAAPTMDPAQPDPDDFFEASFQALAGTRYRVWLRLRAIGNSKFNDSVFVQFSDSTDSGRRADLPDRAQRARCW